MKKLLLLLIITILPLKAWAENISGDMYVAPARYDSNHPAPTTNAYPYYGRVNIDIDDQSHAASTAYVKGAYNSAIAAVNKATSGIYEDMDRKQNILYDSINNIPVDSELVLSMDDLASEGEGAPQLLTGLAVKNAITDVNNTITAKRVKVFTTWDDDTGNAAAYVPLTTAPAQ